MFIHREGTGIILISLASLAALNIALWFLTGNKAVPLRFSITASVLLMLFILNFFRNPYRNLSNPSANRIVSPADGTIVAIEELYENEYYHTTRLKVSIFMSLWNVHCNRIPVSGKVIYTKHHRGKFFIASKPKASIDNERTTTVIETTGKKTVMVRQIAGILARRIICYAQVNKPVVQGDELGFIRFGSRVDLYLPTETKIAVKTGDKVKGNITLIGELY